jgi:hypothetical protein
MRAAGSLTSLCNSGAKANAQVMPGNLSCLAGSIPFRFFPELTSLEQWELSELRQCFQ